MSAIAIITARGGSKRIPRKNIKEFLGKPIITYTINAVLEANIFDEVMVSTDDTEIADIAKKCGASVPFIRDSALSTDTAMTVVVLIDALENYRNRGIHYEYGCCIYPCAPLVTPSYLKEGMKLLISSGADSVVPLVRFSYPPQRSLIIRNGKAVMSNPEHYKTRSQDLEPYYHDAGQFYCFRSDSLLKEEKLFCQNTLPLVLSELEAQDIDTEEDWRMAELKYRLLYNL